MKLLTLCIAFAVVFNSGEAARQTVVGAPAGINVDDSEVQSAANYATTVISDGYGGSNQLGLLQVIKANRQVVAGSLYTLTLAAGRTNCPKESSDKTLCKVLPEADDSDDVDYNKCEVKVWDQPWLTPRYKITKLKCSKPNMKELV